MRFQSSIMRSHQNAETYAEAQSARSRRKPFLCVSISFSFETGLNGLKTEKLNQEKERFGLRKRCAIKINSRVVVKAAESRQ